MAFYDLSKEERQQFTEKVLDTLRDELKHDRQKQSFTHFGDEDTYVRKAAYIAAGRIWLSEPALRPALLHLLEQAFASPDFRLRQTAVNAAGEIGKSDFEPVRYFFDRGLFDEHHSPRNAVIGSIKKMGEVNPGPVLTWAKTWLHHPDKEVRREICHGIELRGRKHPADILPLLQELENDTTARVRNTLVHVLGQIAYKKGCLPVVVAHLSDWKNRELVGAALAEIIDVHHRYRNFSDLTQEEARAYIQAHARVRR